VAIRWQIGDALSVDAFTKSSRRRHAGDEGCIRTMAEFEMFVPQKD